jgi:predicted heme/steroid binding protein
MKKWLFATLILTLILAGCQPAEDTAKEMPAEEATPAVEEEKEKDEMKDDETTEEVMLELSLDELAAFNGENGQPAYVAVDGVIYNLTNSKLWKEGQHNGFQAGADLTSAIKEKSPHGVGKLDGIPIVGKLVEKK